MPSLSSSATTPAFSLRKTSDQVEDLVELLEWREEYEADRRAFVFLDRDLEQAESDDYGSLAAAARSIAAYLREAGAGGGPVLLAYPPGLSFVRSLWGILLAGGIAVPTYPPSNKRSAALTAHILRDSGARFVLAESATREAFQAAGLAPLSTAARWLSLDEWTPGAGVLSRGRLPGPESPAIIQYTSGSVENPKGVRLTHRNILANSRQIYLNFLHSSKSRGLIWLPPYHDMGLIGGIVQPVYGGFLTTLMSPRTFLRDPLNWLRAVTQTRATTSGGPNFAYERCLGIPTGQLEKARIQLSSWRVAFNGAEPVSPETIRKFTEKYEPFGFQARRFMACYGLAEATLHVAGGHKLRKPSYLWVDGEALQRNEVRLSEAGEAGARALTGHGIVGPTVKIVHPEETRACRPGEVGEIWVSGESVASGYWGRQETEEDTFGGRLENDETSYLRTGDLGFIHCGELYVTGRLKDLIVISGRKHYPQDIETTVQKAHVALEPGAGAAFSTSPPEPGAGERLVVVQEVVRECRDSIQVEPLLDQIRVAIFQNHGLNVAEVLLVQHGSIPRTRSGKIRRNACRQMYLEGMLHTLAQWRQPADRRANSLEDSAGGGREATPEPPALGEMGRAEAAAALLEWMRQRVASELRVPVEELDPDMHFGLYGLDSPVAVTMTSLLSQCLSLELDDALFWDYPNFHLLNSYLIDRYFLERAAG